MHALIIEDEPMIALIIEDYLRESGFSSVDIVSTERAAVEAVARCCPDLITSDVRLADGCGIAAVQSIRRDHDIPVLFITATPMEIGQRLPRTEILGKPFTQDELRAALMGACRSALGPSD